MSGRGNASQSASTGLAELAELVKNSGHARTVREDEEEAIPTGCGRASRHPCNALVVELWKDERVTEVTVIPYSWWITCPVFVRKGESATIKFEFDDGPKKKVLTIAGEAKVLERLILFIAQAKLEVIRSNGREVTSVEIAKA